MAVRDLQAQYGLSDADARILVHLWNAARVALLESMEEHEKGNTREANQLGTKFNKIRDLVERLYGIEIEI